MKTLLSSYVNFWRPIIRVMDRFSLIYAVLAFLYTKGLFEFIESMKSGLYGPLEYSVMFIVTCIIISLLTVRIFTPCAHSNVYRTRGVYGDEINHRNARSVWRCLDCGRELDSKNLNTYQKH